MIKRVFTIAAIACMALFACLALTGCGVEDMDEETRKTLGFALGMMIIAASGIGYFASGRYFGRKRQRRASRNRSNTKKRKRR
jgi:hydrogenase/urease accessory protein HupE